MKTIPVYLLGMAVLIISCNDSSKYDINSSDPYAKAKESLADTEKKNPEKFLNVAGSDKKNLLGQTVVRGSLKNNAKIMSYKDVELKLSFYSKTGALLEQDNEVIYETLAPGIEKNFKTKYFTPKGTDSVAMKVVSAKF